LFYNLQNKSGGGSDDGKACLVIIVVLVVVLAFIGLFVGIFLATMFFQRIVQRHMKVLWLKQETKKYIVKDFYGRNVPVDGDRSAYQHGPPSASIPMSQIDSARHALLVPSAPPSDLPYEPSGKYPAGMYEQV